MSLQGLCEVDHGEECVAEGSHLRMSVTQFCRGTAEAATHFSTKGDECVREFFSETVEALSLTSIEGAMQSVIDQNVTALAVVEACGWEGLETAVQMLCSHLGERVITRLLSSEPVKSEPILSKMKDSVEQFDAHQSETWQRVELEAEGTSVKEVEVGFKEEVHQFKEATEEQKQVEEEIKRETVEDAPVADDPWEIPEMELPGFYGSLWAPWMEQNIYPWVRDDSQLGWDYIHSHSPAPLGLVEMPPTPANMEESAPKGDSAWWWIWHIGALIFFSLCWCCVKCFGQGGQKKKKKGPTKAKQPLRSQVSQPLLPQTQDMESCPR